MTEIDRLDELAEKLRAVFDMAVAARDSAQDAIVAVSRLQANILKRKTDLLRADLSELNEH